MEGKVEAVLAGTKSSFVSADNGEQEDAVAMASSAAAAASPAAIFAVFLAPPLSLLRHVACLCAGYLGLDGGLKKPSSAPPPASSPSSSAVAAACRPGEVEDAASEDCKVVLEVRSRGFPPPNKPRGSTPRESRIGAGGGRIH